MKTIQRALITLGVLASAYAVYLAVRSPDFRPSRQIPFLAVALIAHDGLLLPGAIVLAASLGRFIAPAYRGTVYLALFASLVVTLFALPFALGHGRRTDIPSALPLNYTRGLLICLGLVWAAAILAVTIRARGARRHRQTAAAPAHIAPAEDCPAGPENATNSDQAER